MTKNRRVQQRMIESTPHKRHNGEKNILVRIISKDLSHEIQNIRDSMNNCSHIDLDSVVNFAQSPFCGYLGEIQ